MKVFAQTFYDQSHNYIKAAPRDYETYDRDLNLYHKDLKNNIDNYDTIIRGFLRREISTNLVGNKEIIYCTWDQQSTNQLDMSAQIWRDFKHGLVESLGEDENQPRLEYAAEYISSNGIKIQQSSINLANAFQAMMESKLNAIHTTNIIAIILFILTNLFIILVFVYKAIRPLDNTRKGFEKVSNGELNYQLPVVSNNEIGELVESFNSLTQRISALFQLTDRIHQAHNLDDTLKFFHQEFQTFLPLDWIGLIRGLHGTDTFTLERIFTTLKSELRENDKFSVNKSIFEQVNQTKQPVYLHTDNIESYLNNGDKLLTRLKQSNLKSFLFIPLECLSNDAIVLLLATHENKAYQPKHLELLGNISAQISHSLDKTIGMEGLVISNLEGLAKLAESRDPETGDHLIRMSLYSAIITEQLGKDSIYSHQITPSYIRNVFRFAPMHDIGKVGIADRILLKPGMLTQEERSEMEKHPLIGADVLERCEQQMIALGHSVFQTGIEIAGCHHEKYDGTGYPKQLSGDEIPLSARIVAAADVFDALTSKRPYKEAWPIDKALETMNQTSGKHFDPVIIKALEQALPEILKVYEQHKHI
ncbi:MAG: HD domain-containing protein [Gammaproteobacteria bacterium]|nr:HD domain-containing protein [Gammaproteobacteria bacterium]